MIYNRTIRRVGELVREAVENTKRRMYDRDVEDEPTLTGGFIENLRRIFDEEGRINNYEIRIRVLRGIGRKAPEHKFGADICGILNINTKEYQISKGFLMQAKWADRNNIRVRDWGHHLPSFSINYEFRELQNQCNKMLNITPDSFVLLYSIYGFTTVPASSVKAVQQQNGRIQLYSKNVPGFFKEFLMSFIGDHRLNAPDDVTLEKLRLTGIADYILEIGIKLVESHD